MLLELPLRLVIVCLLGLVAAGCDKQSASPEQGAGAEATSKSGRVEIDRSASGTKAPSVTFKDPDGNDVTLASYAGKPLLVNLWATWCAPCVAEMPDLDRLAGKGDDLQVLAVSQDMEGSEEKVAQFFKDRKLTNLDPYLDPEIALMTSLGVSNLPTTVLYDSEGREVWRVTGPLEWNGAEAAKLIAEAR